MQDEIDPESSVARIVRIAATVVAIAAASALALIFIVRASEPLGTDDLFWHLALGRHVLDFHEVLKTDIFSHTSFGKPDVPQQWLSEVIYAAIERGLGPYGLRVLAGVVLAACVAAAAIVLARARAGVAAVAAGVAMFLVLGWWWLLQLRPHGFSIALLLIFCALLEGKLTAKRIAALAAITLIWVNLHAVGLLAPLLALGIAAGEAIARALGEKRRASGETQAREPEPARALALAALLFCTSFATPAGWHLWDFAFSHRGDLVVVIDEWSRLDVFHPHEQTWPGAEGPLYGAAVASLVVSAIGLSLAVRSGPARLLAERRRLLLALAGAALGLSAVRFLFALVLPLAFGLGEIARALRPRDRYRLAAISALAAALCLRAYRVDLDNRMFHAASLAEWKQPWLEKKLFPEMRRFLSDTAIEGDLYNSYNTGGQLLYALWPRCRVFVDARTVVHGAQTIREAAAIAHGIDARALLSLHRVDVYVGNGFLGNEGMSYETLDGDPDWLEVFRSQEVVVRLRRTAPRTDANVERVAEYYRARAIPFDRERGFDAARAADAAPEWTRAMRVLPAELTEPLPLDASTIDGSQRAYGLGVAWRRLGCLERAIASLEASCALAPPGASAPRELLEKTTAELAAREKRERERRR